ncbi:MAG: amino acid ABC transporter permease [Treponema sp.]|nr:amino acid ABC transporter permease [Treponema sp.]
MDKYFLWERFFTNLPKLAAKLPLTFQMVILSSIIGTLFALVIAGIRLKKIPVLSEVLRVFISFERGTPMLVQLLIVYFAFPMLLEWLFDWDTREWDRVTFVIITFVLNEGAFLSETFRASILAIPKLQREAALSCGLTSSQAFFRIVLPQAIRIAIPSWGMNFIGLFAQTSLVFMIGVIDILGLATAIGTSTGHALESYIIVAIFFVIINVALRLGLAKLERALDYAGSRKEKQGALA